MLQAFGPSLFIADGPTVPFLGFPYPTRMAIVQLEKGGVWVWSPIALSDQVAAAVGELGPVEHIVSPNKIHHIFLPEWAERWPDARVWAPPGLRARKPEVDFSDDLSDTPPAAWRADLDQAVFAGSFAMEEIAFFHRASRTAIIGDLVQRHDPAAFSSLQRLFMRADGLLGEHGSTPREWRASFLRRSKARAARSRVLAWQADRLVIAHGACAERGAGAILERALAWI